MSDQTSTPPNQQSKLAKKPVQDANEGDASSRPLSKHWADQTAFRLTKQRPEQETYTCASGITPSGTVHIGNFRELITVDLVVRSLKMLGKKTRFIFSWDDFDTLRKVPVNLPNQEMLAKHLRQSISRVPDPYEKDSSYAAANISRFEQEIGAVGIRPEFIRQSEKYSKSEYAEQIRVALENRDKIAQILNKYRKSPLADEWLPTAIYCSKCFRDEIEYQRYEGEWNYSYKCSTCQNEETVDIRKTEHLKLNWRTDWAMRWSYESVDFEPGGKDHSSQGGSYDTGKQIVQEIWGKEAPVYLQYDFVMVKGGEGKMSSSKGKLLSLSQALIAYEPEIVRWIFASQKPNKDFTLALDEDVIKAYEEYDRFEYQVYHPKEGAKADKLLMSQRVYQLSQCDDQIAKTYVKKAAFRELCNRLQICDGDIDRAYIKYYSKDFGLEAEKAHFYKRAKCAWGWISNFAPESFCYRISGEKVELELDETQSKAVELLADLVRNTDLEKIDAKDLNQKIYDDVIRGAGIDSKEFFTVIYKKLIGRPQGPRLPSFLMEIGEERLLALL